jgi:uncharacterized protein (DUF983 family)
MNRWEANPRESPLYVEHPNTDCDEHGVLHCRSSWNTAIKKIISGITMCKTCGDSRYYEVNKIGEKICSECGNKIGEI